MSKINDLMKQYCPNGVEWKELKDICTSLKSKTLKQNELIKNGEYQVINSGRDIYGYYSNYNNEGQSFTIASRGEYAGFIQYQDKRFWAGGLCYPYISKNNSLISSKFIYYYLKYKEEYIMNILVSRGSIPALNKNDIKKLQIPLPPLPIQQEIVNILDKFTELEAELEAELEGRKKQYEHYRNTLLTFGDDVEWKELGEIAEIYDGVHQTPKYKDNGIKFVSVENIQNLYATNKYISIDDYNKYKVKPQINDLFMTRIGSIGVCSIVDRNEDLAYYVTLSLIRPSQNHINTKFLKYLIESQIGKNELYKRTLINAVPIKINVGDIGKIKLPVPPLPVQEKIVAILDKFDKLVNDIKEGLPAEIALRRKQYEFYRNKLLDFKDMEK